MILDDTGKRIFLAVLNVYWPAVSVSAENGVFLPAVKDLGNYGCWCNFGQDRLNNYGPAQDDYDSLCQALTECLRCPNKQIPAAKDQSGTESETENKSIFNFQIDDCPDLNDFNMPNLLSFDRKVDNDKKNSPFYLYNLCSTANHGSDCSTHSCMCHMRFSDQLLKLSLRSGVRNKFNFDGGLENFKENEENAKACYNGENQAMASTPKSFKAGDVFDRFKCGLVEENLSIPNDLEDEEYEYDDEYGAEYDDEYEEYELSPSEIPDAEINEEEDHEPQPILPAVEKPEQYDSMKVQDKRKFFNQNLPEGASPISFKEWESMKKPERLAWLADMEKQFDAVEVVLDQEDYEEDKEESEVSSPGPEAEPESKPESGQPALEKPPSYDAMKSQDKRKFFNQNLPEGESPISFKEWDSMKKPERLAWLAEMEKQFEAAEQSEEIEDEQTEDKNESDANDMTEDDVEPEPEQEPEPESEPEIDEPVLEKPPNYDAMKAHDKRKFFNQNLPKEESPISFKQWDNMKKPERLAWLAKMEAMFEGKEDASGDGPDQSSGQEPSESSGQEPEESSVKEPNESSGQEPEESSGKEPNESSGQEPEESSGKEPNESSGQGPEESSGQQPNDEEQGSDLSSGVGPIDETNLPTPTSDSPLTSDFNYNDITFSSHYDDYENYTSTASSIDSYYNSTITLETTDMPDTTDIPELTDTTSTSESTTSYYSTSTASTTDSTTSGYTSTETASTETTSTETTSTETTSTETTSTETTSTEATTSSSQPPIQQPASADRSVDEAPKKPVASVPFNMQKLKDIFASFGGRSLSANQMMPMHEERLMPNGPRPGMFG